MYIYIYVYIYMGVPINGGTPSYHPFFKRIFANKNPPAIGVPPLIENPSTSIKPRHPHTIENSKIPKQKRAPKIECLGTL